ncbi:MAG: YdcF family protein, partial [Spirulinaceae cyanobacterium RM2_2_10]|nr:YdcF family protein [Spirulinaceae cyanobacterium RM2_2_10]
MAAQKVWQRSCTWQRLATLMLAALGLILGLLLPSVIGLRLWSAWRSAPEPQAILTLGGSSRREAFTAQFAQTHPLAVWVSSGIARPRAEAIFAAAQIRGDRLHLDYRAVDTVTNFSTLV